VNTAQDQDEKTLILNLLNENPSSFLGGIRKSIIVMEKKCTVARNYIKGGLIVWGISDTFEFRWDEESQKWF